MVSVPEEFLRELNDVLSDCLWLIRDKPATTSLGPPEHYVIMSVLEGKRQLRELGR